jgi:hypothetical protein
MAKKPVLCGELCYPFGKVILFVRKMGISVNELLQDMTKAFRLSRSDLLDSIQRWSETEGREAVLTRDTYAAYKADPAVRPHLATVLVFLEYLATHLSRAKDTQAATRAVQSCRTFLQEGRRKRFDRGLVPDVSEHASMVVAHAGVFALCRFESEIADVYQELLILAPPTPADRTRYETLIGRDVVIRGTWTTMGSSIYFSGIGFRNKHRPEVVTITIAKDETGTDISGGVVSGLTTQEREPVVMPVLVVRVRAVEKRIYEIGNYADMEIISRYRALVPKTISESIRKILIEADQEGVQRRSHEAVGWFGQRIVSASDRFIAVIRGRAEAAILIEPGLISFCAGT